MYKAFAHSKIVNRFSKIVAGIRFSEQTHTYATEAANAINANPGEHTEWLKLADRLAEEGNNAHHMIRAVFTHDYTPPEGYSGSIRRGTRYMENGQHYNDAIFVTYDDGKLFFHYYNGGNCKSEVDQAFAREKLTSIPKRVYTDLTVVGEMPPVKATLPLGMLVTVKRPNGFVTEGHPVKMDIDAPLDAEGEFWEDHYCAKFDHMGHTIYAPRSFITLS